MTYPAIDAAIAQYGPHRPALIALLQAIQAEYRYLPPDALIYLSQKTGIPLSKKYFEMGRCFPLGTPT